MRRYLVGLLGLLASGCHGGESGPSAAPAAVDSSRAPVSASCPGGRRWAVLLDLSGSVTDSQRAAWTAVVQGHIAPRLQACDEVLVFGAHEASATAAPLFVRRMPPPPQSLRDRIRVLRALEAAGTDLVSTVGSASVGQGGAARTNLFDALDRIRQAPDRPTFIVVLSDMEDSSLASPASLRGDVAATVARIVAQKGWQEDRFQAARLFAVLPHRRGAHPGSHSRSVLQAFWRALCARTGGELVTFETFIPAGML